MKRKIPDTDDSRPAEQLTKGEWMYLFDEHAEKLIAEGWLTEFLFYELSRELEPGRLREGNPHTFLREVTEDFFPDTPFLDLPTKVREALLERMHESGSVFRNEQFMFESPSIFEYNLAPVLTDEAASHLEDCAREAAYLEAEKLNDTLPTGLPDEAISNGNKAAPSRVTPDDFSPGTNPGEKAYVKERNRMLEEGAQVFEPDKFQFTLHLDFSLPDTAIIKEFTEVLKSVRTIEPTREHDRRGQGTKPKSILRGLANFRLKRAFGSYRSADEFISKVARKDSPLTSETGWNKSVKSGRELVDRFRSRFELKEDTTASGDKDCSPTKAS